MFSVVGDLYFRLDRLRNWSGCYHQSLAGFEKIRTVGKGELNKCLNCIYIYIYIQALWCVPIIELLFCVGIIQTNYCIDLAKLFILTLYKYIIIIVSSGLEYKI